VGWLRLRVDLLRPIPNSDYSILMTFWMGNVDKSFFTPLFCGAFQLCWKAQSCKLSFGETYLITDIIT